MSAFNLLMIWLILSTYLFLYVFPQFVELIAGLQIGGSASKDTLVALRTKFVTHV